MTKRRKAEKRKVAPSVAVPTSATSTPPDDGPQLRDGPREPYQGVGIRILAIALRHLEYTEVAPIPSAMPGTATGKVDIAMDVEGTINLYEPDLGEFVMEVTARPDPARKPLAVKARMSVLLRRDKSMSSEELAAWINQIGVLIVFPYIRETISTVTGRGIHGPIYLDPISVDSLVGKSEVLSER